MCYCYIIRIAWLEFDGMLCILMNDEMRQVEDIGLSETLACRYIMNFLHLCR